LHTLKRVSLGGLALAHDGKFGDILLADVLTSYAKVIADLFVALCMFFRHDGSATARPDRACGGIYLVPLLIAAPSLIRFRQCMTEYLRVRASLSSSSSLSSRTTPPASGYGYQHLANAAKYLSAFPVIVFSALQRDLGPEHAHGIAPTTLYRCWLCAVLFNSLFSFYWDVARDWDLSLFSPASSSSRTHHHRLLRPYLAFGAPGLYYLAILLDFILRFSWSLKLSPHLAHVADFESGIFALELLEVARRWLWIFFRVETEWVRQAGGSSGGGSGARLGAIGQEDVLLGDYGEDGADGAEGEGEGL
jgi:hypothetical protein